MFGITLTALVTLAPAPTPLPVQDAPPGLVLVKGGKVTVGTDNKEAQEMIKADPQAGSAIAGVFTAIFLERNRKLVAENTAPRPSLEFGKTRRPWRFSLRRNKHR